MRMTSLGSCCTSNSECRRASVTVKDSNDSNLKATLLGFVGCTALALCRINRSENARFIALRGAFGDLLLMQGDTGRLLQSTDKNVG
jgi:hypothetical protein